MSTPLAAAEYGEGPPVVILHGLFGSGRNWASIAQKLAARHRVIALDLRNHGASPWAEPMDYPAMAEDVRATLRARGVERPALLGHSMGGKTAMLLALEHPEEVEKLVVVDIAPVRYPVHHAGLIRAMRALDIGRVRRRAEADAALAAAIPDPAERGFLLQNLVLEGGGARWRINLPALEGGLEALADFPAVPEAAYAGPALFVAGARSDYIRPQDEREIRRRFPQSRIARIENAGHWVHAEQPKAVLAVLEPFLGATAPSLRGGEASGG